MVVFLSRSIIFVCPVKSFPCCAVHRGDFNLNYFQDGILSSAFMVGLLVASPIFASLSKT